MSSTVVTPPAAAISDSEEKSSFSVPAPLRRDLRKKEPAGRALRDAEPVAADRDRLRVLLRLLHLDELRMGEEGHFYDDLSDLVLREGREPRVLARALRRLHEGLD